MNNYLDEQVYNFIFCKKFRLAKILKTIFQSAEESQLKTLEFHDTLKKQINEWFKNTQQKFPGILNVMGYIIHNVYYTGRISLHDNYFYVNVELDQFGNILIKFRFDVNFVKNFDFPKTYYEYESNQKLLEL